MREREAGFTLIEVMIVAVIIAILASIAYPSYTRYVQEARVTDGQAKLMEIAGRLERCYTANNTYSECKDVSLPEDSDDGYYQITGSPDGAAYKLTATHNGSQVTPGCEVLTITQTGATTPNDACW